MKSAEVVICGAGIAGISAAYELAVNQGIRNLVIVDERPPLSLTSDKSSECYRNWWPGPGNEMVALMNRSIDLMEDLAQESGNIFRMNRRGYLFLTANPSGLADFIQEAVETSGLGAGPLRIFHGDGSDPDYIPASPEGFTGLPTGADLILDPYLIQHHFPYSPDTALAALHVRRAGWLSGQQLGMYLLERARAKGVRLLQASVTDIAISKNQIQAVRLNTGETINTHTFVNAAGPFVKKIAHMMGLNLPILNQLHLKTSIRDSKGIIPRQAPLLIWNDPQILPWSQAEQLWLAQESDTRWLLESLPAGVHTRPDGGADSDIILLLWDYHDYAGNDTFSQEPVSSPTLDELFSEIVLRGIAVMQPRFQEYFGHLPRPTLDGGYYTRTPENRPLIGPLPVEGTYILGALSGFGIMAACGAGELLAAHITGRELPYYFPAFLLARYQDPKYQHLLKKRKRNGQL